MLTVTIVEDSPFHADQLKQKISCWAQQKQETADVCCLSDGRELTSAEIARSDILFLDIELPGCDGMSLARQVREQNEEIPIVFTTSHRQYVFKGYAVQAFRYLLKPVPQAECDLCMERARKYNRQKHRQLLSIPYKGTIFQVPVHQILYIEADDHYVKIITADDTYRCHNQLSEMEKLTQGTPLVRCHRSFLVNCDHIHTLRGKSAVLDNRQTVPVSRTAMPAVLSMLTQSLNGGAPV